MKTFKKLFLSKEAPDQKSEKKGPEEWWGDKYKFEKKPFSKVFIVFPCVFVFVFQAYLCILIGVEA